MNDEPIQTGPLAAAVASLLQGKVDTGEIAIATAAGAALLAGFQLGKSMLGSEARALKWMKEATRAMEQEVRKKKKAT